MQKPTEIISLTPTPDSIAKYLELQHSIANKHRNVFYLNRQSVLSSIQREKFSGRQQQFVAASINQWQSHVIARVSPTLAADDGSPLGMLGFFESINDQSIANALLESATRWLSEQGCHEIVGPIDGDTWHWYRFNSGPHDTPPFMSEPTNPDYYPQLWKSFGFEVIDSYHSKTIDKLENVIQVTQPAVENAKKNGYRFRHFDKNRFDAELDVIYRLSTSVFRDNFLYDEISRDQFKALYEKARTRIDPELIWFALDSDGTEVGFLFCIVDFGDAVMAMKGQSHLLAKLRFMLNRKTGDTVNFKSIGVLPEHRRSSLAAALMHLGYEHSLAKGFRRANLCLIRDGNPSAKLDGGQSRLLRRYELYGLNPTTKRKPPTDPPN